jgi:hypothetical protein
VTLAGNQGPLNANMSFSDSDEVSVDGTPSSRGGDPSPVNFSSLIERYACEKYGSDGGSS